jgi:hypothetical protein
MGADGYKRIQGPVSDTELGTTYLKLEPIKEELTWTNGVVVTDADINPTPTSESGCTYTWTFGSTVLAGLTTGVIIQFVEYDPTTKIEEIIWHGVPTIGASNSMAITYLGEEENKYGNALRRTRRLGKNLLSAQSYPGKRHRKPILKMYVLPANYVTKQVRLSNIQAYWQDPIHPHAMWLQLEDWVTTNTGPYSVTVTTGPPDTLTQTALVSDAATGNELYHNIIPYLDTIMTYAN